MEQKTEASQAVDERELLDNDGENRAVRTFLMQYNCDRSTTVGAMLAHMSRSGWRGYAPRFALDVRPESHLTKAGAQIWIRHLMSLEPAALKAQPAPTEAAQGEGSARLDALADEIETMESEHGRECFGKQSDFAHYAEGHENARKAAAARIREFSGAIDRARASAETGGMKS